MFVSRIQVEEGFLDGIDLRLSSGMNVVIGARGTGKTSLIELIRFCLAVQNTTDEMSRRSLEHARAVLSSGRIVVTLSENGKADITVTRTANEKMPRSTSPYAAPLIFSQTEVETLGLVASSRIRLIDGFAPRLGDLQKTEDQISSRIRSLTVEIASKREEINDLERDLSILPEIEKQLASLAPDEKRVINISAEAALKSNSLRMISSDISIQGVKSDRIGRLTQSVEKWRSLIQQAYQLRPKFDEEMADFEDAKFLQARKFLDSAIKRHDLALREIAEAQSALTAAIQEIDRDKLEKESAARDLRRDIEGLQQGAGAIARQGQQLRERKAQLSSLTALIDIRRRSLASLIESRAKALDELDAIRERRFSVRTEIASRLNQKLAPRIRLGIERSGQSQPYSALIADLLRGSGIRYNELAKQIAENISPRELLEWSEEGRVNSLADLLGLNRERAARILSALASADMGSLAVFLVEDEVRLQLLDGQDYKDLQELSTGQRCTIILPIILERRDAILIVDQPEDHIDNAFIAETLIKAMLDRGLKNQTIVSTHNANIPVLGNASRVIHLGSDGRRGYISVNAPLNDTNTITAITSVMEGGREAFSRRASFYKGETSRGA